MTNFNTRITINALPNEQTVASEVLSSAVRILSHLNLDPTDIADLFDATAMALRQDTSAEGEEMVGPDFDAYEDEREIGPWELNALAEQQDFYRELSRFSKRLSGMLSDRSCGDPEQLVELFIGIIAPLAQAQRWYTEQCANHGLEFALCCDEWRATATDEMLDNEEEVVFFDNSSVYGNASIYVLESIAHDLEKAGAGDRIIELLTSIEQEQLELPTSVLQKLQHALSVAMLFPPVMEFLEGLEPQVDLARSELVDLIAKAFEGEVDSFTIENWLAIAAQAGIVEIYKKSNRWRVLKLQPS